MELIESRILLEEQGLEKLYQQISEEFPEEKLKKSSFRKKVEDLIWKNEKVDEAIRNVVRWDHDLEEKFCQLYPYIPLEMAKRRVTYHGGISTKNLKGRTPPETLPGIGRISIDQDIKKLKKFQMPDYTFDEPLHIEVENSENWSIMFLNGANVGTKYPKDIMGNVSRRALSDANERGDVAVIATNIICIETKKTAGPAKVSRSLVFGDNVNPKLIKDPEYRKTVERILVEQPIDQIIYSTPEERLDNILGGWMKIALKPDGNPEYKGPIYIILGNNENALIEAATYWELHWWTIKRQYELRGELRDAKNARKAAIKRGDSNTEKDLDRRIDSITSELNRTKVTPIDNQEYQRFYQYIRATIIRKIEQAIPNAKVIGQDVSYLEIGGKKIEVNIPSHLEVTDQLLAQYAGQYGSKALRKKMAKAVVICHPWALQFRMTNREADYDGKRSATRIFVAPIAVDETYLRKVLKPSSRRHHPLARAVFTEGFQSGVLRLRSINGVIDPDFMSTASLESFKKYPKRKGSTHNRGPKYIWTMCGSDPHWGGRAKEFITSARTGLRLGMVEGAFEMMREAGLCEDTRMPVHLYVSPDDQTQGHHFKARTQPDPQQMPYHLVEQIGLDLAHEVEENLRSGNTEEVSEKVKQMVRHYNYQLEKRGLDFLLDQMMQMMKRNIDRNVDIYRAILKRFKKSQIRIRGVGEFVYPEGGGFDTRNLGAINIGSGNHFSRTTDGELVEGPFYADHLRLLLASRFPEWHGKEDELEKLVVSPLYSGEFIGWGILQIPGHHEYGLDFRSTPPKMAGWKDTLLGATRNMLMRGNYAKIFNERLPVLWICGDKHFCGAVITDCTFFHMCASGTHTDRYGEMGFPPNNTGVSFIGLPVDGPDSGPMLIRFLSFDVIKDFVEDNPRPFNWENFLPNPA
jgi:hypothetical protein